AGGRELLRTRGADTLRGSGNEDNFAVDPHEVEGARKRHNGSMHVRLIPLFPLQIVVFPRTRLPLHIFEERYKEMVGAAIRHNTEFGIVLAKKEGIVNAGCTVLVDRVLELYPDGRMDIMTRGEHRFEIVRLSEEKEYLQAEVVYFDDDDASPVPEDVRSLAV